MQAEPAHRTRAAPPRHALLHARAVVRGFGVVEPGLLYRSGQVGRRWVEGTFRRLRIRLVVNLTSEGYGDPDKDAEREAAGRLGIERRTFHLYGDGTGDPLLYRDALDLVKASVARSEAALVHCGAGAYRTGALVAWYRILVQGWEVEQAIAELDRYGVRREGRGKLVAYLGEHTRTVAGLSVAEPRAAPAP